MADLSEPRVVAVGGPTASGKTALSVALAKTFDGEIINADSMQLYKGLDIGTAKPSPEEQQGIPHHLLDFLPPETAYSVADFTAAADPLIREISGRGRLPFVVGGTGLYITSLLNGMSFAPEKTDPAIRARLQAQETARRCMQGCSRSTPTTQRLFTRITCPGSSGRLNCMSPPAAG